MSLRLRTQGRFACRDVKRLAIAWSSLLGLARHMPVRCRTIILLVFKMFSQGLSHTTLFSNKTLQSRVAKSFEVLSRFEYGQDHHCRSGANIIFPKSLPANTTFPQTLTSANTSPPQVVF